MHENKRCKKNSQADVDQELRKWRSCQCKNGLNGCMKNYANLGKKVSSCSEVDCLKKSAQENKTQWKFRNDFREPCQYPYYWCYPQDSQFSNYNYSSFPYELPYNAYPPLLRWNPANPPCSCYYCWQNPLSGGMNFACKGGGYENCIQCGNRAYGRGILENDSAKLHQGKPPRSYLSKQSLHSIPMAPLLGGTKNNLETANHAVMPFYCNSYNHHCCPPYGNPLMGNYYAPAALRQYPVNYSSLNAPSVYSGEHVCPNACIRKIKPEHQQHAAPVLYRPNKCTCSNREDKAGGKNDPQGKKRSENPNNYCIRYSPNQEMTLHKKESLEILRNEEKCHDSQEASGKYRCFNLNCSVLKD